jgi:dienelactone hydrolase
MNRLVAILVSGLAGVEAQSAVVTKTIEYRDGDAVLQGYLAYDDAVQGQRPGVLVVHEWWGLNDYTKSRTRKLAELGYVAFAVDMYGKGVTTIDPAEAGNRCGKIAGDPTKLRARVRAGLDVLARNGLTDPKRIAAIGYCFGGTTVLNLALSGADVAGVVSFHGALPTPLPEDKHVKAKILVCHGADDPMIPREQIWAFQEGMRLLRADWQMVYYGSAVHAFTNPGAKGQVSGAVYDNLADERSWEQMRMFFKEVFGEK